MLKTNDLFFKGSNFVLIGAILMGLSTIVLIILVFNGIDKKEVFYIYSSFISLFLLTIIAGFVKMTKAIKQM